MKRPLNVLIALKQHCCVTVDTFHFFIPITNHHFIFSFYLTQLFFLLYILETVAFHAVLTEGNPTIPEGSAVLFDEVLMNQRDG